MDTSTVGNQNPWAPFESYRRDCSQGICSIYCPQWCYVIFPPPPPFLIANDDDDGSNLSPLIIAIIISVLVSGFLLLCYYTVLRTYCRRNNNSIISTANRNEMNHDQWQDVAQSGLDDMLIKSITVCKYEKGDGLIEATECAVCLSEFQENENLRLLPQCTHAFHLPCIDTWLKTNTNCPLCRSSATPTTTSPTPVSNHPQTPSTLSISSLQMQRQSDLVVVVEDGGTYGRSYVGGAISVVNHGDPPKENSLQTSSDAEMRRNGSRTDQEMLSITLVANLSERHLSIVDIGSQEGEILDCKNESMVRHKITQENRENNSIHPPLEIGLLIE